MIYHHLFNHPRRKKDEVTACIVGSGHFGTAVVTQQAYVDRLRVPLVADRNLNNARNAFLKAGISEDRIVYCDSAGKAEEAIRKGQYVYTDHIDMLCEVDSVDVLCEGTGDPETGARLCLQAIEHGKHVAAISKEMDSAVGPILRRKAIEAGVRYSPVDGDQPALLMELVEWARLIGLTVISAGKARDGEFILDEEARTVSIKKDKITVHENVSVRIPPEAAGYFQMIPEGRCEEYLAKRAEVLRGLPGAGAFDLCEMTMVANAVNLHPACPDLTDAALRITELPVAYCGKANGGIYPEEGVIDVHTNLHRTDESGMGGGVYLVVRCDNAYSNYILTTKGQIPNYDRSTAVIYRPYHLCGVETSTTILSLGLLGLDTGAGEYIPRYDLVKRALVDIKAGDQLGNDHDLRLKASIVPASAKAPGNPIPAHLITGNIAARDIRAGETLTYDCVQDRGETALWKLRAEQDQVFGLSQ